MIYTNIFIMKRDDIILYKGERGKILDVLGNRVGIMLFDSYTINNTNVYTWINVDDIKLDKKYYREFKLKKFLKSTFLY